MSVDTDEQVDVDLDLTVPCMASGCDSEAVWYGEGLCSAGHKRTLLLCDPHFTGFRFVELTGHWACELHPDLAVLGRFSWRRL